MLRNSDFTSLEDDLPYLAQRRQDKQKDYPAKRTPEVTNSLHKFEQRPGCQQQRANPKKRPVERRVQISPVRQTDKKPADNQPVGPLIYGNLAVFITPELALKSLFFGVA